MNNVDRETVNEILDDFKYTMSIKTSLKKFLINHVDFLRFLRKLENTDLFNLYQETEEDHYIIFQEDLRNRGAFGIDKDDSKHYQNDKFLFEMLKNHQKGRYNPIKGEVKHGSDLSKMSDSELLKIIEEANNKST